MKKINKIKFALVLVFFAFLISFANVYAKNPTTKYGRFLNSGDGQNHGINFDIELTIAGASGFNTHKFNVTDLEMENLNLSGKPAFCSDHSKKNEVASDYETAELFYPGVNGYDEVLARILYYGAGGPGDVTGGGVDDDRSYFATTWVINRFYGNTPKTQSSYNFIYNNLAPAKRLLDAVNEERSVPDDFAYVVFTPDDDELQVISMAAGSVPKNGNLEIVKKDNYGKVKDDATFHITGPGGTWDRTTNGGKIVINDIPTGTYTITETQSPNNMNNEPVNRTVNVEVKPGETITYTRVNNYQRGSVSLTKYDSINRGATKGDASLKNAEFELHASGEIKEGETTVYAADALVAKVVTDENGETPKIENLPIGNYYYIETKASEGFYINTDRIPVSITYAGQYASAATEGHNEAPEEPEYNTLTIIKKMSATSNTPEKKLEDCEFTATLKSDPTFKLKSVYLGDGKYEIREMPYGLYTIEETIVNPYTLKMYDFDINIKEGDKKRGTYKPIEGIHVSEDTSLNSSGDIVDTSKVMTIKIRKVDSNRVDDDRVDFTQGDAQLEGAKYQIYEYNEESQSYDKEVYSITVDHKDEDGYWCAESEELLVGKYMVKEMTEKSEDGYDYSYAKGYLVDPQSYYFEVKPEEQQERLSKHHSVSKEEVVRGRVYIRKEDEDRSNIEFQNDSDKNPAAGAVMRLSLDSNPDIYYEVTLDENGYGEFIETNDEIHKSTAVHNSIDYYPNTIPYGQYTITEQEEGTATKRTNFYTQPEPVDIEKQDELEFRIEMDIPVPVWLEIVKKDADTAKVVKIPNGKYKIWDIDAKGFVKMNVYPSNVLTEFESNEEGKLMLPEKLNPGEYIIYETLPPEGYYLEDEWRLPDNSADYGNPEKGGKKIKIDKIVTGLDEDAVNPGNVQVGQYQYSVDITDTHLRVNLIVEKKGEKLLNSTNSTATYTTTDEEVVKLSTTVPVYEVVGLANVKFELYANKDIVDANGDVKASEGDLVDIFTTNSQGIGQSRLDLYPGEYRLHEVSAPSGYVLSEDKVVLLENKNYLVKSQSTKTTVVDQRQNLNIDFIKTFEEPEYITGIEEKYAVFGVYVKENINNYNGTPTLFADDLVEILTLTGDNSVASLTADLPEGKYYVKELYAAFPYSVNDKAYEFELKYNGNKPEYKVPTTVEIPNTIDYSTVLFVKVSKTSDDNLVMKGNKLETSSNLDEKMNKAVEKLKEVGVENLDSMKEAINKFYEENDIKVVPQATYEIWLNEKGTKKLSQINNDGKVTPATFTTNESGAFAIVGIPKGEYYLKEIKAPEGYEANEKPTKFVISDIDVGATMYQTIIEEVTDSTLLHKTDIYTGEDVPNCEFEIQDKNGKVLLHSVTDDKGLAWIPQIMFEDGETYYYVEKNAPDVYKEDGKLYVLNTEPHEFIAKIDKDGKWIADRIEVENLRPLTEVELIKTDDEGNRVPNCKFELKSVEDGLYYETGVTDENGIYVFKDVPKGEYIYTELEAPEEYEIDTTPHEIYVEGEKMVIEFVNTGDIPVIALSVVALVSVLGITCFVFKKSKQN